jgi:uncharacterized protein (TIGR00156 family)
MGGKRKGSRFLRRIIMKTIKLFVSLVVFMFAVNAYAGYQGPVSDSKISLIKDLETKSYDDMVVLLEGYIIMKISRDDYIFSDGTGEIKVDIDERDFPIDVVTPQTKVRIHGKLDKNLVGLELDAKRVEIIK